MFMAEVNVRDIIIVSMSLRAGLRLVFRILCLKSAEARGGNVASFILLHVRISLG